MCLNCPTEFRLIPMCAVDAMFSDTANNIANTTGGNASNHAYYERGATQGPVLCGTMRSLLNSIPFWYCCQCGDLYEINVFDQCMRASCQHAICISCRGVSLQGRFLNISCRSCCECGTWTVLGLHTGFGDPPCRNLRCRHERCDICMVHDRFLPVAQAEVLAALFLP